MKDLDAIFDKACPADGPGFVVGVARHGELLYRRAFGMASTEHGVANRPHTRMRLASVTKHMTSVAALLLAEEGRLDLDAPASRWLPELPPVARKVTLRQFMQHTSGQRCCLELAVVAGLRRLPPGWCLKTMFRQRELSFETGRSWLYNNGGYELLSEAIARATGQPFEQVMRQRLFEPLGMRDTASVPNDLVIEPGMATLHQVTASGGWMRGLNLIDDNRGAGAVVTTVDDMLRWLAHLRGPVRTLGSESLWRQLIEPARLRDGSSTAYALGLYRHDHRGVEVVHHGGGLSGVASQMVTVPAHGLDIIIMTNGALVNPVQMGWQVVDAVLGPHLSGEAPPLARSEDWAHLRGAHYVADTGMLLGFDDAAGSLGLRLVNSPPLPLLRDLGTHIGIRVEDTGFGPLRIDKGQLVAGPGGTAPAEIVVAEAGLVERFRRLPGPPADGEAGTVDESMLGRFHSDDLGARGEIAPIDGRLSLTVSAPGGGRVFAMQPLGDDTWGLTATDPEMPGFYALTAERRRGRVAALRLSTVRARRLRFDRVGR